ncbi:MAG: hypothetical protein PHO41_10915 [Eubacteriales bacterium]|nr:hypothetical protein [Eubacteriales bacterium]
MDATAIIDAFFQSAGPWAALAVILLFMQWYATQKEERSIRQSLELLATSFENFVKDFHAHDARSERMCEMLTVLTARKERAG